MARVQRIHPAFGEILEEVFDEAAQRGITVRITSAFRSIAEQRRLFRRFGEGRAARPGGSFHNFGLAVDIATSPADALDEVGLIAEEFGLRWGGRFTGGLREPWHIDMGSVISIAEAQQAVTADQLVEVA